MLSKIKSKLPLWLGGQKRLKPEENAEAISLAALKGVEILARMQIQSNGFLTVPMMAAQFRSAAISTSQEAKNYQQGSLQRAGLEFMATQLSDVADNLINSESKKEE